MSWANDQTRYGRRHRWQRKQALNNISPGQRCTRCGLVLLPPEYEVRPGVYQFPHGWLARNIHLDHRDGSDTVYLGLAHTRCNVTAAARNVEPAG